MTRMETMSGAAALMRAMEKEGVREVFGLPGGANLPMYDELYKSDIRHILVRHEQSAAHMADGFGRVSRKPGVCFATSGPGATNILTGIATAQADSAPMIAVTGQVPVKMIGRDAFQESDIIGMANPVVKYAFQPRSAGEIPEVVKKGFYIAETGRPGPVLLDIPKDVQQNKAKMTFPDEFKLFSPFHPSIFLLIPFPPFSFPIPPFSHSQAAQSFEDGYSQLVEWMEAQRDQLMALPPPAEDANILQQQIEQHKVHTCIRTYIHVIANLFMCDRKRFSWCMPCSKRMKSALPSLFSILPPLLLFLFSDHLPSFLSVFIVPSSSASYSPLLPFFACSRPSVRR